VTRADQPEAFQKPRRSAADKNGDSLRRAPAQPELFFSENVESSQKKATARGTEPKPQEEKLTADLKAETDKQLLVARDRDVRLQEEGDVQLCRQARRQRKTPRPAPAGGSPSLFGHT